MNYRPDVPSRERRPLSLIGQDRLPSLDERFFLTERLNEESSSLGSRCNERDKECGSLTGWKWRVVQRTVAISPHFVNLATIACCLKEGAPDGLLKILLEASFPPISWIKPGISWRTPKLLGWQSIRHSRVPNPYERNQDEVALTITCSHVTCLSVK